MALEVYTGSAAYVRGSLLVENASLEIDREGGGQRVLTIAKGFAGISPGARFMTIRIRSAVPAVGFEYDPGPDIQGYIVVPFVFFAADSTLATNAFVMKDKFAHAVNSEAMIDMDMDAEFALWR